MTSSTLSLRQAPGTTVAPRAGRIRGAAADVTAQTVRVLLNYRHSPGLIVASLAAPPAMLVVFGYVFGSAITAPGDSNYREYLMPGLFVLIAFNSVMPAMVGAARDAGRGITDRLLSMSVSRGGVLLGQALADLLVSAVVLAFLAADASDRCDGRLGVDAARDLRTAGRPQVRGARALISEPCQRLTLRWRLSSSEADVTTANASAMALTVFSVYQAGSYMSGSGPIAPMS